MPGNLQNKNFSFFVTPFWQCLSLPPPLNFISLSLSLSITNEMRVAVVGSEKLVAEARDSSGTQSKGNVASWKRSSEH
jgi:hypothetical protein